MRIRWLLLLTGLVFFASHGPDRAVALNGTARPMSRRVSLVDLIANAEMYDGMSVSVIGYINTYHEDEALFLSREDYENYVPANSVRIILPVKGRMRSGQFAIVEGVFRVEYVEHTGQMGKISPVARVDPWWLAEEDPPWEEAKRTLGCR